MHTSPNYHFLTLSHLQMYFDAIAALQQTTFENIVAKGEIAHNKQFLLRPQCFQLYLTIKLSLMDIFRFLSQFFQSRLLQICCLWNELSSFFSILLCFILKIMRLILSNHYPILFIQNELCTHKNLMNHA